MHACYVACGFVPPKLIFFAYEASRLLHVTKSACACARAILLLFYLVGQGGLMSAWPQAAAEHLAINEMVGLGAYHIPCFAGDLNKHIIVHTYVDEGDDGHATWELHVAQHEDSDGGKKLAAAYMSALLAHNLARLDEAQSAGATGGVGAWETQYFCNSTIMLCACILWS
jgi:hypothetical protein